MKRITYEVNGQPVTVIVKEFIDPMRPPTFNVRLDNGQVVTIYARDIILIEDYDDRPRG